MTPQATIPLNHLPLAVSQEETCPRAHPRAFTLIELLLAMFITVGLAAALYGSMRAAFIAQKSAEEAIETPRVADLAMSFLRTDLQNALQMNAANTSVLVGTFVGSDAKNERGDDADDLVFYTTADSPDHAFANGEVKKVELLTETPDNSNDHVLVRRVTRNLLSQVDPVPDEEILCRHVAGFSLRYFDGTDWQTSWDSTQYTNAIPSAVEVTLTLEKLVANQQPTLVRYTRVFTLPCSTTVTSSLTGLNN